MNFQNHLKYTKYKNRSHLVKNIEFFDMDAVLLYFNDINKHEILETFIIKEKAIIVIQANKL